MFYSGCRQNIANKLCLQGKIRVEANHLLVFLQFRQKTSIYIMVVMAGWIKNQAGPRIVCLYWVIISRFMKRLSKSRYCQISLKSISKSLFFGFIRVYFISYELSDDVIKVQSFKLSRNQRVRSSSIYLVLLCRPFRSPIWILLFSIFNLYNHFFTKWVLFSF